MIPSYKISSCLVEFSLENKDANYQLECSINTIFEEEGLAQYEVHPFKLKLFLSLSEEQRARLEGK